MMKLKTFIAVATGVIGLTSCKPDPLPQVSIGTTVFSFEGTIDGEPVNLVAGEEGVYQEISVSQTEEGLYEFSGKLGQEGCDDCPEQLALTIRDLQFSETGALLPITEAPLAGQYNFYYSEAVEEEIEVAFALDEGLSPSQLSWDFGDGNTASGLTPVHVYRDSVLETVTVCLQTSDGNGCVTSICNVIDLTDTTCRASFQYEVNPSEQFVTFKDKSEGSLPFRYEWTFGDGFTATLGNPGYYYSQSGRYDVCLKITDDTGCESHICKEISPDLSTCTAGYSYEITKIESGSPAQEGTVSIRWIDEDKRNFFSQLLPQTEESFFEITSAERYPEDQAGLAAWKITFALEKEIIDGNGVSKTLEGNGVMAVGFPAE